jgi:hypothetical protein
MNETLSGQFRKTEHLTPVSLTANGEKFRMKSADLVIAFPIPIRGLL